MAYEEDTLEGVREFCTQEGQPCEALKSVVPADHAGQLREALEALTEAIAKRDYAGMPELSAALSRALAVLASNPRAASEPGTEEANG